jgi:polar amino acid transport system substrate-binding protein
MPSKNLPANAMPLTIHKFTSGVIYHPSPINYFLSSPKTKHFLWLITLLLFLAACQPEDNSWSRVRESGILRVGLDPTYPPFETADGGPLQGLDVDLAHALAADLGLEAQFTYFGYDGLYDALATEQVDVLISALVISPERTRDFAYSDSYYNAGQVLIAPQSAQIAGREDLNGRTLAVELGAEGHVLANTWERQLPELTVMPYNNPDDALTTITTGEADAVLIDSISGRLFIKNLAAGQVNLQPSINSITEEPFAMVFRIDDRMLLEMLNNSLRRLKQSGELETIIRRWLG